MKPLTDTPELLLRTTQAQVPITSPSRFGHPGRQRPRPRPLPRQAPARPLPPAPPPRAVRPAVRAPCRRAVPGRLVDDPGDEAD